MKGKLTKSKMVPRCYKIEWPYGDFGGNAVKGTVRALYDDFWTGEMYDAESGFVYVSIRCAPTRRRLVEYMESMLS